MTSCRHQHVPTGAIRTPSYLACAIYITIRNIASMVPGIVTQGCSAETLQLSGKLILLSSSDCRDIRPNTWIHVTLVTSSPDASHSHLERTSLTSNPPKKHNASTG